MVHLEYLSSLCDLSNCVVADIGAGDGIYSKQLHLAGARVTGIEIDAEVVENTRKNIPSGISMKVGRAEALPLEDNSVDLACFFFSFHHVPGDLQRTALNEVCRVVKPSGRLHVVEPYPYGSMFDVVRFVEDETEVRTHSHQIFGSLDNERSFNLVAKTDYVLTREYPDFEFFVSKIVGSDPDRSGLFQSVSNDMRDTYEQVIREEGGKRVLDQPCAAYHFEIVR